jgi:predicted RNase H-like HicB family nuclease
VDIKISKRRVTNPSFFSHNRLHGETRLQIHRLFFRETSRKHPPDGYGHTNDGKDENLLRLTYIELLAVSSKRRIFAADIKHYMAMKYTMVVNKGQNGFLIGQLKELPEVFTQGESVEELKENIADALEMYLEDMRENYRPNGETLREEEIVFA